MNFPSFSGSENFNPGLSVENYSQDSSIRDHNESQNAPNLQGKQDLSKNDQRTSHQKSQSQHPHDNFDEMNQSDVDLRSEVQLGSIGHKKIKKEESEAEENDLQHQSETDGEMRMEEEAKPISEFNTLTIEGMFQKLALSQGKSTIFYQHHQCNKEERNIISESFQKMFSKQCKITSLIEERKEIEEEQEEPRSRVTFQYFEFDMNDYILEEILGQGLHGLVIKLKGRNYQSDAVLKLFTEEKAFTREATILSILQKAKEHERPQPLNPSYSLNHFHNGYFKTGKHYGLFVKVGLGSLGDFRKYLQKTEQKLTGPEIFIFTFSLLHEINSLHEVSLCHRDIKPENIVIDPETFEPVLIDFSLASEISKAEGGEGMGTEGYRMMDFGMENQEIERRDQLISRDYFALGITILKIMFPDCRIDSQKAIKDRLRKLAKFKNICQKILAETLETCIFGSTERKENILKELAKEDFEICGEEDEDEVNKVKKEKIKYICESLTLWSLEIKALELKKKHDQGFKKYMTEKWSQSNSDQESKLEEVAFLQNPQEMQISENFKEYPVRILEESLFCDEERYIRFNIGNDPEGALEICYEIIYHLVMIDYQTFNPRLYSTVMAALFLNDFLDDAIALGIKACEYQISGKYDWILRNNLTFLFTQRNLRDHSTITPQEYGYSLQYLINKYKDEFISDLTRICKCAYNVSIKECIGTPSSSFFQEELVLTYIEMELLSQESYFFMNYCYLRALQIDQSIDESTRNNIQEFVYGINFFERTYMLKFLNITALKSVLLAFNSFCEIFIGGIWKKMTFLEKWIQERICLKKDCIQLLQEGKQEKVWEILLSSDTMHAMIGFIIWYSINNDRRMKFDEVKWMSLERETLRATLSDEEFDSRLEKLRTERTKKWSRQKFLNTILLFQREIQGNETFLRLDFKGMDKQRLTSLSILDEKLENMVFPDCSSPEETYVLLIDFEENSILVKGVKCAFGLESTGTVESFFTKWNMKNVENLDNLRLELSHYKEGFSHIPLGQICSQFSVLKLLQLTITMKTQIQIKDEDFLEIKQFISTQDELVKLILEFNLCLITSKSLESLADALKEHKDLLELNLTLKNCPEIEEESIYIFLEKLKELKSEELKKLPNLQFVNLSLGACRDLTSYTEPNNLPFKTVVKIDLQEVSETSFDVDALYSEEHHNWCFENYDFEGENGNGNDLKTLGKEKEAVLLEAQ